MEPFRIHFADDVLDDLRVRLRQTVSTTPNLGNEFSPKRRVVFCRRSPPRLMLGNNRMKSAALRVSSFHAGKGLPI